MSDLLALRQAAWYFQGAGVAMHPREIGVALHHREQLRSFNSESHTFDYYHPGRGWATLLLRCSVVSQPEGASHRDVKWFSSGRHEGKESGFHGSWWADFEFPHSGPLNRQAAEERCTLQLWVHWNCVGSAGHDYTVRFRQDRWSPQTFWEEDRWNMFGDHCSRAGPIMVHRGSMGPETCRIPVPIMVRLDSGDTTDGSQSDTMDGSQGFLD